MSNAVDPDGAGAFSRLARIRQVAQEEGDAAAEAALWDALDEEPNSAELLATLARRLSAQKRYDEAERVIAKTIELAPLDARAAVLAGFIQIWQKRPEHAVRHFADAIRLDPESPGAHLGLATVQMLDEDYESALRFCDRALDLDPTLTRVYEMVARINVRQGRNDLALAEMKEILDEDPNNERVVRAYLRLLRKEGRDEEAAAFLGKIFDSGIADRKLLNKVTWFAVTSGQAGLAVDRYRSEGGPKGRIDRIRFIKGLIESGEIDEARREIAALGYARAMTVVVHALHAEIALKQGNFEAAIRGFKKACSGPGAARTTDADAEGNAEAVPEGTPEERARAWRRRAFVQIRSTVQQRLERHRARRDGAARQDAPGAASTGPRGA